jgi:AcrR family transcriptional regulator
MASRKEISTEGENKVGRRGPRGQRGEVADRILSAARGSFATHGYAGTRLRDVAVVAGVDPSLVSYYFADKTGLLAAALEPPAGMAATAAGAAATPIRRRGRALVEALLSQWENPATSEVFRSIILTAAHEPVAMERLRVVFETSLLAAVADNLDGEERDLRAGLVASQMIGLAMARFVWRVGALARLPSEEVARYVAPTVQRYLSGRL